MKQHIAEACYKYNYRDQDDVFGEFVKESMKFRKDEEIQQILSKKILKFL